MAARAWVGARDRMKALTALFFAYCALLAGPSSQLYRQVDHWQDLSGISRDIRRDAADGPLILLSPDETTLAAIDLYSPNAAQSGSAPLVAADAQRAREMAGVNGTVLVQLPKLPLSMQRRLRTTSISNDAPPAWIAAQDFRVWKEYAVPNGRRYALLKSKDSP
jgi:hypothetical protein